jgi:hypothetical protein
MNISPIKQLKQYSLYIFEPGKIPPQFHEDLGFARAQAFSQSCGITNQTPDVDDFDDTYYQIVLRDEEKQKTVGGYRLGLIDELLKARGPEGLYSSSLYTFTPQAFEMLGKSIELGRSFVHPDYQKVSSALGTLWSGIAWFVATKPEYNKFIGMVTISQRYSIVAKWLMIDFMERKRYFPEFNNQIVPMNPFAFTAEDEALIKEFRDNNKLPETVFELEKAISQISDGTLNMPSILKYYLRYTPLGLMCYGLDPDFGGVVDLFCFAPIAQAMDGVQKLTNRFTLDENQAA